MIHIVDSTKSELGRNELILELSTHPMHVGEGAVGRYLPIDTQN